MEKMENTKEETIIKIIRTNSYSIIKLNHFTIALLKSTQKVHVELLPRMHSCSMESPRIEVLI